MATRGLRRFAAAAGVAATCIWASAIMAAPEHYKIDPVHSSVTFKVRHFGVSDVRGRFNDFKGDFTYDRDNPSSSTFEIAIDADSLDTKIPARDEHTKSAELLDAKKYPTISFKSTSVKKLGDDEFEMTGDVTMHGQTHPLTATLQKIGEAKDPKSGDYRIGGETTFVLKRSQFGIDAMPGALGEDITVTVSIEGLRQDKNSGQK